MPALLTPITNLCQSWVAENVLYQDWQVRAGNTIAIEQRMTQDILDGLEEEGFAEGEDYEVVQ